MTYALPNNNLYHIPLKLCWYEWCRLLYHLFLSPHRPHHAHNSFGCQLPAGWEPHWFTVKSSTSMDMTTYSAVSNTEGAQLNTPHSPSYRNFFLTHVQQWCDGDRTASLRSVAARNCNASANLMIQETDDWWLSIKYLHILLILSGCYACSQTASWLIYRSSITHDLPAQTASIQTFIRPHDIKQT